MIASRLTTAIVIMCLAWKSFNYCNDYKDDGIKEDTISKNHDDSRNADDNNGNQDDHGKGEYERDKTTTTAITKLKRRKSITMVKIRHQ